MSVYSPFVYWGQNKANISLRVDLKAVTSHKIDLKYNQITFYANGSGAKGSNDYAFHFDFFANVLPKESYYKISERQVEFNIKKEEEKFWPRLCFTTSKPSWLKVDFDKLVTEDTEDENMNEDYRNQNFFRDLKDKDFGRRKKSSKMSPEEFRKVYLFLYDIFQFVGFIYVMVVLTIRYAKDGPESMAGSYKSIGQFVKFLHILQLLEVLHPLLGYTRGSVFYPTLQLLSKWFMIFIMIDGETRLQNKPPVFYLLIIYSLNEIVRYPYYMLRVFRVNIDFLTWLRYTFWIVLFPLGFVCEVVSAVLLSLTTTFVHTSHSFDVNLLAGVILLRNISYFEETRKYSVSLPNAWNFSFYLPHLIRLYLLFGFFPLIYMAMRRMYYQRVNMLGSQSRRKTYSKFD